jgi:hypothetical protein
LCSEHPGETQCKGSIRGKIAEDAYRVFVALGRKNDAFSSILEASRFNKDQSVLVPLIQIAMEVGETDAAQAAFTRLKAMNPDYAVLVAGSFPELH